MRATPRPLALLCPPAAAALVLLAGCSFGGDTDAAAPGPWPLPGTCAELVRAAPSVSTHTRDMELSEEWFNDPAQVEMPADAEAAQAQSHDAFPGLHCGWMGETGGFMLDVYPHQPAYTELRLSGTQAQTEVEGVGQAAVYRADAGSLTSHTDQILVFTTALGQQADQEEQAATHREILAAADAD